MDGTFFDGDDELYHHAKFGEDRTTCAGCRCENVVFVTMFVFFCLSRSESVTYLLTVRSSGGYWIVRTSIALPFIALFRCGLQRFSQVIPLSGALHSSHIRR